MKSRYEKFSSVHVSEHGRETVKFLMTYDVASSEEQPSDETQASEDYVTSNNTINAKMQIIMPQSQLVRYRFITQKKPQPSSRNILQKALQNFCLCGRPLRVTATTLPYRLTEKGPCPRTEI